VIGVWNAGRVGYKISPTASIFGMEDSDPAATFGYLADELSRRGIAYLHVAEAVAGPRLAPGPRIAPGLRSRFGGALIVNGGYDFASGEAAVASGEADFIAYGVPFLANPDLPERFRRGASLNEPDPNTFYAGEEKGYTDYPALGDASA